MAAFAAGFALGLSLILAIGAQNAFVLRQGIRGEHVLAVVLTCALSDALLIAAGVAGMGGLVLAVPGLESGVRWAGAAFLAVYGFLRFRSAWYGGEVLQPGNGSVSLKTALATCLALTWLNPHVYLDTVILIGSVSTHWPGQRLVFWLGATTASFSFFFVLGYGAGLFRDFFARPGAWRVLDIVIGATMWLLAIGLAAAG